MFYESPRTTVSANHLQLNWSTEEKVTYILDDPRVHFNFWVNIIHSFTCILYYFEICAILFSNLRLYANSCYLNDCILIRLHSIWHILLHWLMNILETGVSLEVESVWDGRREVGHYLHAVPPVRLHGVVPCVRPFGRNGICDVV